MKKTKINNKMYSVLDEEEFRSQSSSLKINEVAVQIDNVILPYNGALGTSVGYYDNGAVSYPIMPTTEQIEDYTPKVFDFSLPKNGKELMEMNKSLKSLEKDILRSEEHTF